MGGVAIIVPVLRRPHRVRPLLDSIEQATPEPHSVLFVASPGDAAEHEAVRAAGATLVVLGVPPTPGDYARKINHGVAVTDEPLVFLGADDLHFHPGWLAAAKRSIDEGGDGIGVVGTNDLGNSRVMAGEHATHSLVARWYCELGTIDEPGKVLHEGYPHEFVDDEFVGTAKRRGAWAWAGDSIVEHLHPLWKKAPTDPLYDAHPRRMREGRRLFRQRSHLWT